ncbi:hypothetical protein [Streptomyces sp. NPDC048224]|uniref:hypothetical protein n=1 Tax=Streptomyces sp. NPDC048224 TaxID=3154500 RepID=UPI003406615C
MSTVRTVLSPSTAGTGVPPVRASDAGHRLGGPARVDVREALPDPAEGADLAVVRLPGGGGAFGGAATADRLVGYGATAGVVHGRTYGRPGAEYVFAPEDRGLMKASGPWAPGGSTERPPQAAGLGLWAEPDARTPQRPRATDPESEGDLEGDDK